jgi:hypothetical protein
MAEHEWMRQARSLGAIDEMWDDSTPSAEALRMCFRCPVRRDCAEYGLKRPSASDAGVLGGLGLYDRDRVREGKVTVQQAWDARLSQLVAHDYDEALADEFAYLMPRLALA